MDLGLVLPGDRDVESDQRRARLSWLRNGQGLVVVLHDRTSLGDGAVYQPTRPDHQDCGSDRMNLARVCRDR